MGQFFTRPISQEQIKAREQKRQEQLEQIRKTQTDLIMAELLSKIAKLEAKTK